MKSLSKSINEQDCVEKGSTKDSIKNNFSISSKKKFVNKSNKDSPSAKSINMINKNKNSPSIFYLSNISISNEEFINSSNYQNINKLIYQIAYHIQPKSQNKYFSLSEKILLDLFINFSEFNKSNYDFYISYFNLCKLLKEINLLNTPLINDVILSQNDDLDIILKEILSNKSSKNLNFKDFLRFLAYLTNKIDPLHFIDKPRNALNFIISKYFYSYYDNNKNNLISLIFSYIFSIKLEKDINKILEEIINFLKDLYTTFFKDEIDNSQNTNYCIDEKRSSFKYIINSMKYLDIFPVLINIKELAIMYYILLNDNNNNNYLNVQDESIKEMNKNFTFGKFCQFFLTLSLYIKEKNFISLKQYSHLLNEKANNNNFDNVLKNGVKEGIIKFIINLKIKNLYKQLNPDNSNIDFSFKISEKGKNDLINSKIISLDNKELNFIRGIFESYSSDFDQYFNYQISFSEIITFLKHYNLLIKNNDKKHSQNFLKEELTKAQNYSRNNIVKLKRSLHSLDFLFDKKINKNNKIKNNNLKSNQINLVEVEIIFSKVICLGKMNMNINKSMDNIFSNTSIFNDRELKLKHNLNFKFFVYFLFLISTKLSFNSFSEFIAYLSDERDKIKVFKLRNREINLKNIYQKYNELNASELIDIIQEFSPLINMYYLLYTKVNKNEITFNLYKRIFSEFEIFPKIVNNELLKNIFYVLYHIKTSNKENIINNKEETIEDNLIDENREIGFKELMNSFGIIALYLSQISQLNIIQSLLSLFYIIIKSEKIKPSLKKINSINLNFVEALKDKVIEISKKYNNFMKEDEPEFIQFLKNPYL